MWPTCSICGQTIYGEDFKSLAFGLCPACWYSEQRFLGEDMLKKAPVQTVSDQWINRIEVPSESSNNLYIVSQHKTGRYWSCSCPSGKTRKICKHLKSMGLPGHYEPFEPSVAQSKKNDFMNYKQYDGPKGSPQEWAKALNNVVGPKENEGERIILFDDEE